MAKGRKPVIPKIDPALFELVIDSLTFPLERHEVRQLLLIVLRESTILAHDGDGLLRKYRRRTPKEIVDATYHRLCEERHESESKPQTMSAETRAESEAIPAEKTVNA